MPFFTPNERALASLGGLLILAPILLILIALFVVMMLSFGFMGACFGAAGVIWVVHMMRRNRGRA